MNSSDFSVKQARKNMKKYHMLQEIYRLYQFRICAPLCVFFYQVLFMLSTTTSTSWDWHLFHLPYGWFFALSELLWQPLSIRYFKVLLFTFLVLNSTHLCWNTFLKQRCDVLKIIVLVLPQEACNWVTIYWSFTDRCKHSCCKNARHSSGNTNLLRDHIIFYHFQFLKRLIKICQDQQLLQGRILLLNLQPQTGLMLFL